MFLFDISFPWILFVFSAKNAGDLTQDFAQVERVLYHWATPLVPSMKFKQ